MGAYRRKFGGKIYAFEGNTDLKSDAKAFAKQLRKKGIKARVTSGAGGKNRGWDIWIRRKK